MLIFFVCLTVAAAALFVTTQVMRSRERELDNRIGELEVENQQAGVEAIGEYPTEKELADELAAAKPYGLREPIKANLIQLLSFAYALRFKKPELMQLGDDGRAAYNMYRDACLEALQDYEYELPDAASSVVPSKYSLTETVLVVPTPKALEALVRPFKNDKLKPFYRTADPTTKLGTKPAEPVSPTPQEEREYRRLLRQWEKDAEKAWKEASQIDHLLAGTPFFGLERYLEPAMITAPLRMPERERFEGSWMVAPSGSGKTNALLYLIQNHLHEVGMGQATVIVLDSSGTAEGRLLHYLSRWEPFKDRLRERLIVLESSFDHPLALNLFDVDLARIQSLSGDERAMALSSARSMIEYVLGGLLGAETTKKQGAALGYLIEALMRIPGATIFTLAELLTDEGYDKHRPYILKMDSYAVDFFENRFRQKYQSRGSQTHALKNNFAATKQEIFWRIDAMVQRPEFRRMFSHPRNKVEMFDLMQSGKLILINTNKPLLQETGAEVFGRFMIAKIYQAAERRLTVSEKDNLPVYVYIDECHDYIRDEPRIVKLLDQLARKNRIAFTFAHQRPSNLSPEVLDAVSTTAIRFASRSEQDAAFIAQRLRVDDPTTLSSLDQGQFAYLFREHKGTRSGVTKFPLVDFPLMTEEEYAPIREDMRRRFCAPPDEMVMPSDAPPHVDEEIEDEESTQGDPDFR